MSKKLAVSLMAGVATILVLFISGCSTPSSAPTPTPTSTLKTTPTVAGPVELFPQEGYAAYLVKGTGGVYTCDKDVATAHLTMGGTVELDGATITVTKNSNGVTISYTGNASTVAAIVNKTIPVTVPAAATKPAGFYLATRNFANAGITDVIVCGGGM